MPEKETQDWSSVKLGSFLHVVFEVGVKKNCKTLKEFLDITKEIHAQEEWQSLDIHEITLLVKIFFERNKRKYNEKSLTEQPLWLTLEGVKFFGIADRIDFTDNGIEIIDYKTGKTHLTPLHRDWQLGYYALAAQNTEK